jgi:hypothetical protein
MLGSDEQVRLRVAGRKDVSAYFGRYSESFDWKFAPGLAEGRAALLVSNPDAQYIADGLVVGELY